MSDYSGVMLTSYAVAIGRLMIITAEEPDLDRLRERAAAVFSDLDRARAAARAASDGRPSTP